MLAAYDLGGRLGPGHFPEMNGTVQLRNIALTHTSFAVPVDRLDLDLKLEYRRIDLSNGVIRAGTVGLAPLFEAARKKGEATIVDELKKRLGDLFKRP